MGGSAVGRGPKVMAMTSPVINLASGNGEDKEEEKKEKKEGEKYMNTKQLNLFQGH